MENVIDRVVRKIGVTKWWAETVAIEYLNCRDYLEEGKIWVFNWNKIEDIELEEALNSFHVIARGVLFHNVRESVLVTRILE